MRTMPFIEKLVNEEKIKIGVPSRNIASSYDEKSRNALRAARIIFNQKLFEEAVSMAYYAMYHKATALFYLIGIKCESHAAVIVLLKELFGIDNTDISFAKKERVDKQYYIDFIVSENDVKDMISLSEKFTGNMDIFIDKLTEEEKKGFLQEFKKAYF